MGAAGGQYWASRPAAAHQPGEVHLLLPDVQLTLATDAGVFAREGVDPGTKLLLLDGPAPPDSGALLDLGCGYGAIAVTLATRAPGAEVWALDVNERARELCRANAERAGLANVRVAAPDDVPDGVRFAGIWSNPPIRIGKEPLHALLSTWLQRLDAGAAATFVVHKHLGSDSLQRWLGGEGWAVQRTQSRGGYRLLEVRAGEG